MTYKIKCDGCGTELGESSVQDVSGHLCALCNDEKQFEIALLKGDNYDVSQLHAKRPAKVKAICESLLLKKPDIFWFRAFHPAIEATKKALDTDFGLTELNLSEKVEAMTTVISTNDISKLRKTELLKKVTDKVKTIKQK